MGGGYGLRLFLGFAAVVLVMLLVSGAVFVSAFGGYRDQFDRSELRAAGNVLSVEIARLLRGSANYYDREVLVTLIRAQADHAGLIVILTDGHGRVLSGFEPRRWFGEDKADIDYMSIVSKVGRSGWFETKLHLAGEWRPALARILVHPGRDGDPGEAVLMAVTFGDEHSFGSLDELVGRLLLSGLVGLGAAVLIAMILSRQLKRPLEALTSVVRRFGPDRYDARAAETGPAQVRDLARAFNAMAERVAANERAMQGFIADVSHELRTPLTSIRGFVEALRDGTVSEPERREHSLDVIQEETQRMLRMVEQLLDLSRLEAGQYRLQSSRIDLGELIDHALAMFEVRAEGQGLELHAETAPATPVIEADYDRLVQVLSNLLDNALRHTAEGSVTVSARPMDDGVELRVSDSGEGIAPDDLERLFDRFWQPESRSGPGAGLGLAISREIVRAHGGRISAASELGVGTTITVWLPAG